MHNDDHAADRRWHDLVLGLRADLDGIVEDFLSAVGLLEPYSRGQVPLAVLRHDAVSSFTHLIDELASRPRADHVTTAHDVGTDRARRGVPLPALMSAIRIDVEVLWTRIRGAMRTEDMPLVLDRVERLWEVVERYNRDVQQAYLEEQTLMTREREDEVGTVLTRLLDGPVTPALVGRFAGLLGVPEDGPLLVAAVPTTRRRGLWTWFRELIAERRPVHWQTRGDDALLVTSLTADQARDLRRGILPPRVSSVPCAVGPLADGVEDLPRSARLALRLARVLPVGSEDARRIRDLWLPLARADLDEDALTARRRGDRPVDGPPRRRSDSARLHAAQLPGVRLGQRDGGRELLPPQHRAQPPRPGAGPHRLRSLDPRAGRTPARVPRCPTGRDGRHVSVAQAVSARDQSTVPRTREAISRATSSDCFSGSQWSASTSTNR